MMTIVHTAALVVATVALSPTCGTTALSLFPRGQQRQQPHYSHRAVSNDGDHGLFGKRPSPLSRRGGGASRRWMFPPAFQSAKIIHSANRRVLRATEEKEAGLFFTEETEPAAAVEENNNAEENKSSASIITPVPPSIPPPPKPVMSETSSSDQPSIAEKIGAEVLDPILNPIIAKNVPPEVIRGAAVNGAFLALLTSFVAFGPFSSITSPFTTLVAATSAAVLTAYVSITEGTAGDYFRGIGRATMEVSDMVMGKVDDLLGEEKKRGATKKVVAAPNNYVLQREMEVNMVADALLERPPTVNDAKTAVRDATKSVPLTEGMTADEAEAARITRLVGGPVAPEKEEAAQTQVAEGQTAEQAEDSRRARDEEAARLADEARAKKEVAAAVDAVPSVDYDAAARLAYEASGESGKEDFETFKARYLVETSAYIAKKHWVKVTAEKQTREQEEKDVARIAAEEKKKAAMVAALQEAEIARLRLEEEEAEDAELQAEKEAWEKAFEEEAARMKAAKEAREKATAEEEAAMEAERIKAEEEARAKKAEEEAARVKAEEEAQAKKAAERAARIKAEEEALAKAEAEEEALIKAEEEAWAKAIAEEAARVKAEEEAKAKAVAEEAARVKAAEEAKANAAAEEAARVKAEQEARAKAAAEEASRVKAEEEAKAKAAAEEASRVKAEEEAKAKAATEEAARVKAEEEARLAKLAEEEEQRRLEEQAEAAREAVRLMQEQESMIDDDDDDDDFEDFDDDELDDDELDDEDWEASVRLANELQGMPGVGGDGDASIVFEDELLRNEIESLTPEEEDALGKAAREAVRKYEEEMAAKRGRKDAVRSSWDEDMVTLPSAANAAFFEEDEAEEDKESIRDVEEAGADFDCSKMTVAQLKELLRNKGLKVSGKKAELIERLKSS